MFQWLKLHRQKLVFIFGLLFLSLSATLSLGEPKPASEIDWVDVFGEGGSALALAVWMVLILGSRPAGRVTDLLTLGLGFLFLAMWQDALDEFIRLPSEQWWDQSFESVAMPFGIALLTYGLYHWHREQLSINQQLNKREKIFRDHRLIDRLTQLGHSDYLKKQLNQFCFTQPLVLMMIDIDDFQTTSRLYGHRKADRLLSDMSDLLLLNLRETDLICRYGGDRFAIVLPNTNADTAETLAHELRLAAEHVAFKLGDSGETLYQSISIGYVEHSKQSSAELIKQANAALAESKAKTQAA